MPRPATSRLNGARRGRCLIAEGFCLDVEIDVIVEVLADTHTEIDAVRLSATEQTKTHFYSSVRASQREPMRDADGLGDIGSRRAGYAPAPSLRISCW
jgi:hypothetical protein